MPIEITMPQLSDTMTEGTVVKWLKKEGDKVNSGEIIAEIETDKATMEQESFEAGTLAVTVAQPGAKVKVGDLIAVLAGAGEKVDDVKKKYAGGKAAAPAAPAGSPASKGAGAPPPQHADDVDPEEHAMGDHTVGKSESHAGGAPSRGTATMPPPTRGDNGHGQTRLRISPLARRMAEDKGLDLTRINGSGPGGRIVQKDIEAALSAAPATPAPSGKPEGKKAVAAAPLPQRIASGQKEVIQLSKMRATIAQRLQQSKQNIPHFYESIDIDVEELSAIRVRMNKQLEAEGVRLSIGDFVAKAVAVALQRHPALNAHYSGTEITRFGDVHLGMAVALPEGLIVPVLRNINQMGLREIRQRSADLVDRARAQKLKGDEMTGATFTVSNLGTYGVKEFSAIINPPEVGILAVAAAEKRPVVRGDQIVPRTMMTVTLSADHRAVDGAGAADFLRTLKALLEEPGMMLV
jgi:pyruvate dehydrogenase E2 component (dihydrolipoamide acetyltransferase)